MQPSSHTLDRLEVVFDDEQLVVDAGLIQTATLAQHLACMSCSSATSISATP